MWSLCADMIMLMFLIFKHVSVLNVKIHVIINLYGKDFVCVNLYVFKFLSPRKMLQSCTVGFYCFFYFEL